MSLEAGVTLCWYKYVNYAYGIDTFGLSGKIDDNKDHFNFTTNKIIKTLTV
jgi:transketolase